MALTVTWTKLKENDPEDVVYRAECTFDSSYPTGGEELDASGKVGKISYAHLEAYGKEGYLMDIDPADYGSGKLKLVAYYGNYDAADGVLIEVPNATDLSGVTGIRVIVHGYAVATAL